MALLGLVCAGCEPGKEDGKGVVDDSEPPSSPVALGKADGAGASARTIALDVRSAHPYANNLDQVFTVSLAGLPPCAQRVRLHFAVLRTEPFYDRVSVEPIGAPAQVFDGNHDDTWTEWFPHAASVRVRLRTDYSITRHGFAIDKLEWDGAPEGCPVGQLPACAAGTFDVTPRPGTCACAPPRACAPLADLAITHRTSLGFNNRSHQVHGDVASETHPGPTDGPVTTVIGTVDGARVGALIERAAELGLLHGPGYERAIAPGAFREQLTLAAGDTEVTFVATQHQHEPAVQRLIAAFEALFACGTPAGTLRCDAGFTCEEETCVPEDTCVCPAVYLPVCGSNGRTYSNGCAAGCARAEVAHDGECGLPGDPCGPLADAECRDGNKCRFAPSTFTPPHAGAGGTCVAPTYCDAPSDCIGLPHIAVPGVWACREQACAWQAGSPWQAVPDGRFETPHPYANSTSVWKELYLPDGAAALRLVTSGTFQLESGYDFLEVWTWIDGAWRQVRRYTGSAGPALAHEFPGRYHYLRFVSDSSITRHGFRVDAEYR